MVKQLLCSLSLLICLSGFAQESSNPKPFILSGATNDLNAVAMSPAKYKRMAVAGWDNTIFIYNTDTPYTLVQKLSGHTAQINCIAYNLSGNMMASASGDMSVRFYDSLGKYLPIKEDMLNRHMTAVNTLIFDRSGKFLFSGDREGRLMLWDALLQKPIKYYATGNSINDLCLSPNAANIFVAHSDKSIKLIALAGGKIVRTLDAHTDAVNALAISTNNQFMISGSNDKTAIIWDLKTWKPLHVLKVESWKVTAVAFTDDSKYCVTGSNDGWVKVWEVSTGKLIGKAEYPDMNIRDLCFSKDYRNILIAPKMKEGENFGARYVSSLLPIPEKAIRIMTPAQKSLDSIMAIRPLNKQDSIKFKNILMPRPVDNKSENNKGKGAENKQLDSAVIYKTPMNQTPKKK